MIAHNAKAPVVPCYIKGTEGCFSYLQPKARLIKAEMFYGKPLYFEAEYARKGDRATLQAIADRIMQGIAELREEAGDGPAVFPRLSEISPTKEKRKTRLDEGNGNDQSTLNGIETAASTGEVAGT
jgi:hypothetical protein